MTELRAKHAAAGNDAWGVDGCKGVIANMTELGIWEPLSVKMQTLKTVCCRMSAPWAIVGMLATACQHRHPEMHATPWC